MILVLHTAWLLFLTALSAAGASDFLFKQQKVNIYVYDKNGREIISGSGFLDKNGVVATRCSLILKWLEDVEYVLIVETGKGDFQIEKLLSYSRRKDVATFKIESKPVKMAIQPGMPAEVHADVKQQHCCPQKSKTFLGPPQPLTAGIPKITEGPGKYKKTPEGVGNAETYFHRGLISQESKHYRSAIEAYKMAIKIKPDYLDAYVNLGQVYYKLGRYSEAADFYKKAVKIKPDAAIYNKLGTLYIIARKYSVAVDAFEHALVIDPENPETHFNLGITYFLNGDKDAAYEEYIILNRLDGKRAEDLFDLLYR